MAVITAAHGSLKGDAKLLGMLGSNGLLRPAARAALVKFSSSSSAW
jgi:hypothetical protein